MRIELICVLAFFISWIALMGVVRLIEKGMQRRRKQKEYIAKLEAEIRSLERLVRFYENETEVKRICK